MLPNKKFAKNLKGEIKAKKNISFQFDDFFCEIKIENSDFADCSTLPGYFCKVAGFLGLNAGLVGGFLSLLH